MERGLLSAKRGGNALLGSWRAGRFLGWHRMEVYKMVAVGTQAPDFELSDDSGQVVKLSHFRGRKVILYFYPKALTKG
jgi:cytochrome oxidase Cu insertion factor (SCO1/SenC/PrrC family)